MFRRVFSKGTDRYCIILRWSLMTDVFYCYFSSVRCFRPMDLYKLSVVFVRQNPSLKYERTSSSCPSIYSRVGTLELSHRSMVRSTCPSFLFQCVPFRKLEGPDPFLFLLWFCKTYDFSQLIRVFPFSVSLLWVWDRWVQKKTLNSIRTLFVVDPTGGFGSSLVSDVDDVSFFSNVKLESGLSIDYSKKVLGRIRWTTSFLSKYM